nr:hypothetical protein [Pseudochrobactrum saccharolyticum]
MAETIKRGQETASASPAGGITGDMKLMNWVARLMLRDPFERTNPALLRSLLLLP